jgi:arginine N-succinyltransferase
MLNLPADRKDLTHRVEVSIESFSGHWDKSDPRRGEYVFVLEDVESKTITGTSAIIGQHGTRIAPHISFEVGTEENYSPTVDVRMIHKTLELVHSYEGPTEIGGLLLEPKQRKTVTESGVRLGTQLSFVRFLYMAMRPERFQPVVLAEMMPPHVTDGWSPLWDALGAKFTGLSYADADARWRTDKDFVEKLFPTYPIYVTLLPQAAQDMIGVVDEQTKPALKLLESVGFRYSNHVDPFDGGPHYSVKRDEITLVKKSLKRKLAAGDPAVTVPVLIGVEPGGDEGATFRAIATIAELGETTVTIAGDRLAALEVPAGAEATVTPLA